MATTEPAAASSKTSSADTAPLGIKIICVVFGLVSVFGLFPSLGILFHGRVFAPIGILLLAYFIGLLVVLYGLWTLQSWAWPWALVFLGTDALIKLVTVNVLGLLISFIVLVYIVSKEDHY